MTRTVLKLANTSNFGPSGTVPYTVQISNETGTITETVLSQYDLFFIGYYYDGSFSASELTAMYNWVNSGGRMLITADASSFDDVAATFGYASATQTTSPQYPASGQSSHPIFSGPFGTITSFNAAGSIGYFPTTAGATVLARSGNASTGLATLLEKNVGSGKIVMSGDICTMDNATLTSGNGITNNNDIFMANLFHYIGGKVCCTIPSITSTTPAARCGTGSVVLGATASSGTVNWYDQATGGSSIGTGTSFTTPSISATTTYYVDATDNVCTTESRTAVTATINEIPSVSAGPDALVYFGYAPQAATQLNATMSPAIGGATYSWSPATGLSNPSIANPVASPEVSTVYTVTVTVTATGCTASDDVTVTVEDVRCGNNLNKISIYHKTGNDSYHAICVAESAIPAHLAHGDVFVLPKSGADHARIAEHFSLDQNYPNPFNPSTVISYSLPNAGNVFLRVFDMFGREVATLVQAEKPAGMNKVEFNASSLESGTYFYTLEMNGQHLTRSMTLLK